MILLVKFHIYFELLLSKRAHLKTFSEKKAHQQKTFGGGRRHPFDSPYTGGLDYW